MRISILFIGACALVAISSQSPLALAQESTSTPTTTPEVSATPEPVTPPTVREERRAALSAAAQARLTNLAANVSNRMDAYVRRITNVTDRLESRASKLQETGLDVSAARGKIADARAELEKARQNLATIDSAVAGFVGSENPRTYWQQVKTTYLTARDAIKGAHRATVETLLLLQTATAPAPTGTTTESTPDDVE
ncbi:MAG: hypothetical protein MUF19_03885 [Candidatus Pacebacteria bacterium]|jgi:hypothetical protein|nr:hypothetical protein [Candidatus Paceibacterota bacterium]